MSTPPIVIIAEPDPTISSVLRVEFTRGDFAVLLAASGQEAEDYAAQTLAHLVILDTRLHLGAYDACARIRRSPGYAKCPIVLTTSEPSAKIRAVGQAAGATTLLCKPYSVSDLFNAIRPFLPPRDPLLAHHARISGMSAQREWAPAAPVTWRSSGNSALSRNGQLMPIVRGQGVKIPMFRKPQP